MSDDSDLYVSNGTCYFGEGQISDSSYIPCGNAYLSGAQHCCYKGDYCLSSYSCYDTPSGVTYLAGCTDPAFLDEQCAQKPGYDDQQWVAMARCSGANVSLWTGCAHHANLTALQKEDCSCNTSNVLIDNPNGKSSLDQIGSLPSSAGGTISFNPTALPTYAAATTTGNATGTGGGTAATAGTSAGSASSSSGLSAGAKAGISIGAIVGGLLVFGLLFLVVRRVHRNKVAQAVAREQQAQRPVSEAGTFDHHRSHKPSMSQISSPSMTRHVVSPETVKADDDAAMAGGMGYKNEMSADPAYKWELPGVEPPKQPRKPQELSAQW